MEKRTLSEEERREVFKKLKKYQVTKNWKDIIKGCEKEGERLQEAIKEMIADRKEVKVEYSELDKLNLYVKVFESVIGDIDDTEGGKLFKNHIQEQLNNAYTNIYDKVEIGFDAPIYSDLDMTKTIRQIHLNVYKKLDEIATYYDKVKETVDNSNPYEEMKEEDMVEVN